MTETEAEKEGFGELFKFTAAGFAGGLILGAVLDSFGFQRSATGQWLVRTLSGEGESIFEGAYSIRQRLRKAKSSHRSCRIACGTHCRIQPHDAGLYSTGNHSSKSLLGSAACGLDKGEKK